VWWQDEEIALSKTEFDLLELLVRNADVVLEDLLSVTVLGPTLLWADVYATAAFAMGADAASWLRENASDYAALVVDADGRLASRGSARVRPSS
jgi:thiamine biosynthesis lipoprotein ApbE